MTNRMVLGDLVDRSLAAYQDRTAFVLDDETLTYAELDALTTAVCGRLVDAGIRSGDSVALLLRNQLEYPVCDVALMRLGAAKVPLNEMLSLDLVGYMLEHSDAKMVIVSEGLAHLVPEAPTCPVRLVGDGEVSARTGFAGSVDRDSPPPSVLRSVNPDSVAAIYYTGGTTGRPKGVVHTQDSLVANMVAEVAEAEIRDGERILLATPLPHAAGLFMEGALLRGARIAIMPSFDPAEFARLANECRATWTFCVPTMIYRLLDYLSESKVSLPSFVTLVYGASPMSPSRLRQAAELLGNVFIQLYGQTECPNWGTRLSKQQHEDALKTNPERLASCGTGSLMADVRIVDEDFHEVPVGVDGEVALRSQYVMRGYHKDPEATSKQLRDGWLKTGDIGNMDDYGFVYLKDRVKDMIITGGMNVYTTSVEAAVAAIDGVSQAAVVGAPDPDWGEVVVAFVTLEPGSAIFAEGIREACRGALARYEVPKRVEVLSAIPVTPYGKPDKKRLRDELWTAEERKIN